MEMILKHAMYYYTIERSAMEFILWVFLEFLQIYQQKKIFHKKSEIILMTTRIYIRSKSIILTWLGYISNVLGFKTNKRWITMALCYNAIGVYKLPLLSMKNQWNTVKCKHLKISSCLLYSTKISLDWWNFI